MGESAFLDDDPSVNEVLVGLCALGAASVVPCSLANDEKLTGTGIREHCCRWC